LSGNGKTVARPTELEDALNKIAAHFAHSKPAKSDKPAGE
jgi:hypothetical protein